MAKGVNQTTRLQDAKIAFILGALFMALFSGGMLCYLGRLPEYLAACISTSSLRGAGLDHALAAVYWTSVSASFAYIALFIVWWLRAGRPWRLGNELAFSRQAWAGLQAWRDAQADLLNRIRGGQISAFEWTGIVSLIALAVVTVVTAGVMLSVLIGCDACHAEWRGRCTSPIGSAVSGVGIMLIYAEMRIKFR